MSNRISAVLIECLQLYNNLLAREEISALEAEVPKSLWQDELGRLRVWAANIGAHQTGQSSLDYRLRDASHIKDQVIKLLSSLRRSLQELEELLHEPQQPLADDSSDGGDDSTEAQQIYDGIVEIIMCLLQLSMQIRRPAHHDRLLGTRKEDVAIFEPYDKRHVVEKFPQTNDEVATRLGAAISRRRAALKYRERHHAKLSQGISLSGVRTTDGASNMLSDTIATEFHEPNIEFDDTESTSGISQTSYAQSILEGSDGIKIPPPPKESADGKPFECPYCYFVINIDSRRSWARHVFRDIMPYSCTLLDCSSPQRLYASRREWYQHLREGHSSFATQAKVTCPLCPSPDLPHGQIERHLGRHLEELALFAIPRPERADDREGSEELSEAEDSDSFSNPDNEQHTIKCVCPYDDDEEGSTVFCEKCETWQHILCYYPDTNVPEVHHCFDCQRSLQAQSATERQRSLREQAASDYLKQKKRTDERKGFTDPDQEHVAVEDPWLLSEDYRLLEVVGALGTQDWERVSLQMQHRSEEECRKRFYEIDETTRSDTPDSTTREGVSLEQNTEARTPTITNKMSSRVSLEDDIVCRAARDDERDVMEHFSDHCASCHQCADPYRAYLKSGTLCDRGHAYARDVGQYIYSKGGKAFSRVDREERGEFNQVAIPAGCEAVKSLLKAVNQGLKVRTSLRPVIDGKIYSSLKDHGVDANVEVLLPTHLDAAKKLLRAVEQGSRMKSSDKGFVADSDVEMVSRVEKDQGISGEEQSLRWELDHISKAPSVDDDSHGAALHASTPYSDSASPPATVPPGPAATAAPSVDQEGLVKRMEAMFLKGKEEAEKKAKEDADKAKEEADAKLKEAEENLAKAKKDAEEAGKKASASALDEKKAPIRFHDAVGRKFNFPWHLCSKWTGIEELIRQAFEHVEEIGPHVQSGHYDLTGPDGEIIIPSAWETTIKPDWKITMHMWPLPEKNEEELPPKRKGKLQAGSVTRPKKSKEKKQAEKDAAEAAYAEMEKEQLVRIAPKEDSRRAPPWRTGS